MPSSKTKEPEGSTANLPPEDVIAQAEANVAADVDEMFGISEEETPPDGTSSAAAGGEATTTSAAGAAGVGSVDGQAPAPATPQTPPAEGPVPGQTATGTDGTSSAPSGQEPAKAGETPAPAAAPAPVAPVDPNLLKVNSLEAQVLALTQALAEARANPQAAPQAQPGPAPQGGQASGEQVELPRYTLTLPPAVAAAINSGDEQQTVAGITHMMNSLASIVHHNVRLETRQLLSQLAAAGAEQDAQGAQAQAATASREDYYNAFPQHKDPLILPIIQAESMAMAGEFPGLKWDDNYRNALGQRVEARLAALRGAPAVTPVPPTPAAMLPTGAREGPAPGTELTGGDLIVDTFS